MEDVKIDPLAEHRLKIVNGQLRQMGRIEGEMRDALQKRLNQGKPMGISLDRMVAELVSLIEEMNETLAPQYATVRHRGVSGKLTKEALRRTSFPFENMSELMLAFYGRWHAEKMPTLELADDVDSALMGMPTASRFAPSAMNGLQALRIGFRGDWARDAFGLGDSGHPVHAVYLLKSYMRVAGTDGVNILFGGLSAAEDFRSYADELSFLMPMICEAYEKNPGTLHPAIALWASDGFGRTEFEMIPVAQDQTIAEMFSATTIAAPIDVPDAPVQLLSKSFIAIKQRIARVLAMQPLHEDRKFASDPSWLTEWQTQLLTL